MILCFVRENISYEIEKKELEMILKNYLIENSVKNVHVGKNQMAVIQKPNPPERYN